MYAVIRCVDGVECILVLENQNSWREWTGVFCLIA